MTKLKCVGMAALAALAAASTAHSAEVAALAAAGVRGGHYHARREAYRAAKGLRSRAAPAWDEASTRLDVAPALQRLAADEGTSRPGASLLASSSLADSDCAC